MKLTRPLDTHFVEMTEWFSNEKELKEWAGPNFRYPFDLSSFVEDLNLRELASYVLISDEFDLLGFGQFYRRLDKCHLGRLIVNPKLRGRGVVSDLMSRLCEMGSKELGVTDFSLFVLMRNRSAINAYSKFGFVFESYPEELPLRDCLYMIKT